MAILTDEIQRLERLAECAKCEFRSEDFKILGVRVAGTPQCKICGCTILGIAQVKTKRCPKQKF